jgi:hypothetical protein
MIDNSLGRETMIAPRELFFILIETLILLGGILPDGSNKAH